MTNVQLQPGKPVPLGATWDGRGVNFALFSQHATRIELCFFDSADAQRETVSIPMSSRTDRVWHTYVAGCQPGQLYAYRVYGPYEPSHGHRFNGNKVVLDPYAKAIGRDLQWTDEAFGYRIGDSLEDLSFDTRDNAATAPLAAVIDPRFHWGSDRPPRVPWERTVIYEAHVTGLTKLHPHVPADHRGTYAGLASKAMIAHLKRLGVTTVELLPVQYFLDDRHLVDQGLRNYWGYSPITYFALQPRYAVGGPLEAVREFKTMVKRLHRAGIEVLLDVVYNHTGEGNRLGPTLSFRGVDNATYYRLERRDRRHYTDFSGCGNCLEMRSPIVMRMIADSLRYWVEEMHVDGFRFDLAPVLGRDHHAFNRLSPFFQIVFQDPVLSQTKLIAEPWDLGDHGYQLGGFPVPWREWNGKYRDTMRDFWRGEPMAKGEFATRVCGSQDIFPRDRRSLASINFVTCHDGFTLRDLVSYNHKHNHANGEDGNDGEGHNRSWNCGVEGETRQREVVELRYRQMRNFLSTLLLSKGVPMLRGGDELAQTQQGNNNAYCQDNELSWIDWNLDADQTDLVTFTQRLIQLRAELVRRNFFVRFVSDLALAPVGVHWLHHDGRRMKERDWHDGKCQVGALLTRRSHTAAHDAQARRDDVLLVFNAHHESLVFHLPELPAGNLWRVRLDTSAPQLHPFTCHETQHIVEPRSVRVFEGVAARWIERIREKLRPAESSS